MAEPEENPLAALDLAVRAADMLDRLGDRGGAIRLRHAIAIIRNDATVPPLAGFAKPIALMKEALALLDGDGRRLSPAAMDLQSAIDAARSEQQVREGDVVDPVLLAPAIEERSAPTIPDDNH